MTQFQKNVVFITAAVLLVVAAAFGINFAVQVHTRQLEAQAASLQEQKDEWRKDQVRAIKSLTVIGQLSIDEQKRFDAAGDDPERIQQVLIDIHQERSNYWENKVKDVQERQENLQNVVADDPDEYSGAQVQTVAMELRKQRSEANDQVAGYAMGLERIQAWRPTTFQAWQQEHAANPGRSSVPAEDKNGYSGGQKQRSATL